MKGGTQNRRGMAMVGTMLVMLCLMSLVLLGVIAGATSSKVGGNGLMNTTANAIQMAQQQEQSATAFNLADAGIEYALQWIHSLPTPPANSSEFTIPSSGWSPTTTPASGTYTATLGGGTFAIRIYPDAQNFATNNSNPQDKYLIESVGTDASGKAAVVHAYIEQTSFGRYAYFTVSQPSNLYWNALTNSFDGPVHFDDVQAQASDGTESNVVWLDNTPMFRYMGDDAFSYSGAGVNWYHNNTSTAQAPTSTANWQSVDSFGQAGVQQRPSVALPASSATQQFAAMGQTPTTDSSGNPIGTPTGIPSTPGVTLPTSGGIYVEGNVTDMVLSVNGSGNQVVTVTQTDSTNSSNPVQIQTTVTLNKSSNTTTMTTVRTPQTGSPTTTTASSSSSTNGVIYVDGSVGSPGSQTTAGHGLSGTIANNQALTISTPSTDSSGNAETVNINGNLTYNTPRAVYTSSDTIPAGYQVGDFKPESDPANANFIAKAGTLGLVTNTVQLTDNDINNNNITNLQVDASILAYGTLTAMDYTTRPPGKFVCMGGQICNRRGALGQFNSSTLATISGLPGKYSYDQRLATSPPPFFPTTKNVYKIDSWEAVPVAQKLP
jgi:hypothetical protein